MSVSSLAASGTAQRVPQAQPAAPNRPTQQTGAAQGTSRGHHHGGGKGGGLAAAGTSQAAGTPPGGSLLDLLI